MPDYAFETLKKIQVRMEVASKHSDFNSVAADYWEVIWSESRPIFDQFEMQQKLIPRVKKKNLLAFFDVSHNKKFVLRVNFNPRSAFTPSQYIINA